MTNEMNPRFCIVNDRVGYFHAWEHYSKPAGVLSQIFGIVEFEGGVQRVDPTEIIFCDDKAAFIHHINNDEPSAKEKSTTPSQDACHDDILNVLLHTGAVTCNGDVTCYESMTDDSKVLYKIPSNYKVTIDYNKMAKALYDAGYRKSGSQ